MPKKKPDPLGGQHLVGAVERVVPLPAGTGIDFKMPAIACPACKSKISADGRTLHEKSGYLDELIETDAGVDEIEKKIEKMQKAVAAHEATIAELRIQLAATERLLDPAASKSAPKEKEKPSVVQKRESGNAPTSSWD